MRISDWSSDVCSSDLGALHLSHTSPRSCRRREQSDRTQCRCFPDRNHIHVSRSICRAAGRRAACAKKTDDRTVRSEEHTSELQSLMRISYAVFCLTKKNKPTKLAHYKS